MGVPGQLACAGSQFMGGVLPRPCLAGVTQTGPCLAGVTDWSLSRGRTGLDREPDGTVPSLGGYFHGVDHVPDEEQSPASRALLALELAGKIGHFGAAFRPARGVAAAAVGDRDGDLDALT